MVMPGLVPGIHVLLSRGGKDVDGRDEPGHDAVYRSTMTTVGMRVAKGMLGRARRERITPRRVGSPAAPARKRQVSRRLHRSRQAWETDRAAPSAAARCRPVAPGKYPPVSLRRRMHKVRGVPWPPARRSPRESNDDTTRRFW